MKIFKSLIFYFIVLFSFLSCEKNNSKSDNSSEKIKIISSFSILTDIINQIGNDVVEVHNLVPVGTDPHEYEPVSEDIKFASKADLFIYNGLNLEGGDSGWFKKLTATVGADPSKVIKASENITPLYLSGNRTEVNPHSFISPAVGMEMAKTIAEALIKADPENKTLYQSNMEKYVKDLKSIDEKYRQKLSEIPKEKRIFMASEQAFQYLTQEYGLKEGFIWSVDTEENGSPNQIKKAIAFARENQPPVLFVESNVDQRPMQTISKETGIPIYLPPIFSDELGKPGKEADSYLSYLEYNLKHIYKGLSGK